MFGRVSTQALVCLHGLGRTPSDWDGVRRHLEQLGRVVTPALPRDVRRAQQVAADATPPGAILIGHSLGAVIAMTLAAEPARAIRGVVASSSFFPPALNGRSWPDALVDYACHRLALVRDLRNSDRRTQAQRSFKGIGFLVRTGAHRRGFLATTESITAPLLVVHAEDDHYVPVDFAMAAVGRRPGWDMAVLADGGHYPHVKRATEWLAAVDPWLERLVGGST
ncbi:MAG: hypothetical protein QOI06_1051 [Nocardioidaceae bacterium]|jgi:pimeloyl-ACP methyl ester carboxylesterase|nr:hypothetical protein [Nocardioidaceae bacterium]